MCCTSKSLEQQSNVLQHIKEQQNIIKKDTQAARVHAWQGQKNGDEIIWAEIFNNVISNIQLKHTPRHSFASVLR